MMPPKPVSAQHNSRETADFDCATSQEAVEDCYRYQMLQTYPNELSVPRRESCIRLIAGFQPRDFV